jgi:hypothetical protein
MFELKTLSREAIPRSLEKAERYRLLNEAAEAESICLDILAVDPDHQPALVILLLARTDRMDEHLGLAAAEAEEVLPRLHGDYERAYYAGIICERRAKARLRHGGPGAEFAAYDCFRAAMRWYERAEALCPAGNDDATLRWNACARIMNGNPRLRAAPEDRGELPLE